MAAPDLYSCFTDITEQSFGTWPVFTTPVDCSAYRPSANAENYVELPRQIHPEFETQHVIQSTSVCKWFAYWCYVNASLDLWITLIFQKSDWSLTNVLYIGVYVAFKYYLNISRRG